MIDRLISMILAGLCCLGLTAPAAVPAAVDAPAVSANAALSLERTITYSDVPADHWSASSVNRATALGLFQGVGENTFGRGQPISRAAFVTALMRLFDWEPVTPEENAFTDVTPERWFYSAVETALANEAIAAAESTFRPTEDVTREEMAWYAGTPEPYDKAGAYGVQGLGALLVREIQGDYYTVMGLPVSRLWRELAAFAPGKLPLRGFLA